MATKSNQWLYRSIALIRICLGATLLWAFFDKLVGLGYSTCLDTKTKAVTRLCEKAWLSGGSPTGGFLENATKGPFAEYFKAMSGITAVDWLFMLGLLLIGLCLILGVGIRVATTTGAILFLMMWLAALPPQNNPVLDEHIIYILALMIVCFANNSQVWGLGGWWQKQKLVHKYSILQ